MTLKWGGLSQVLVCFGDNDLFGDFFSLSVNGFLWFW